MDQKWFGISWYQEANQNASGAKNTTPTTSKPVAGQTASASQYGTLHSVECDCLLSFTFGRSKNITRFEVEEGKPLTDNIRKQPLTITAEIYRSSTPVLSFLELVGDVAEKGIADGLFGASHRLQEFYSALKDLYEWDDVVSLYTRFETFENMCVSEINLNQNPDDGDCLLFSVSFQEVRKATASTAAVPAGIGVKKDGKPAASGDTAKRAGVTKNAGANTGVQKPVSNQSVLKAGLEMMGIK